MPMQWHLGAQLPLEYSPEGFSFSSGISAVYSEQQNVFQGQYHADADTDDLSIRYLDSGRKAIPI
jgi:hypothetical protein